MSKFYRNIGIICIAFGLIMAFMKLDNLFRGLMVGFTGVIAGLALISLGNVIDDIKELKDKINSR